MTFFPSFLDVQKYLRTTVHENNNNQTCPYSCKIQIWKIRRDSCLMFQASFSSDLPNTRQQQTWRSPWLARLATQAVRRSVLPSPISRWGWSPPCVLRQPTTPAASIACKHRGPSSLTSTHSHLSPGPAHVSLSPLWT